MSEPNLIPSLPQSIDPLAPCPHGRYDDHLVSVLRADPRVRYAELDGLRSPPAPDPLQPEPFFVTSAHGLVCVTDLVVWELTFANE